MPTAPKLIASVFFGLLAWFCGDLVKPLLPDGTQTGWLNETLGAVGLFCGWSMSGKRAGDGLRAGFGYGLTSSALIVFWGVLIFAGYQMLMHSLDNRYRGPTQAMISMVDIALAYLRMIGTPEIIGSLIVGGLFGGWLAEWAAKRWT